ncbi:MAG: SEC-C domain-containing protein [Candidatus Brocadia sp.]|nr:SEC-C domain-containing protein [Candidatus Brocadia sp.]
MMTRLPESKVKQAILHPESEVRDAAIAYFSKSFTNDKTIMPLVIEAIEKYGWEHSYPVVGRACDLPQTDATIHWMLNELSRDVNKADMDQANYFYSLGRVLAGADPALLLQQKAEILESGGLSADLKQSIMKRIDMHSWGGDVCWKALEDFCKANKTKRYINEVNIGHAFQIIKALSRDGERYRDRIVSLLAEEINDFENNPMRWMEPLVVALAGEMRLGPAIPLIIKKLKIDSDFLAEECMYALSRIGNDSVIEAVSAVFSDADSHFRSYASGIFRYIHSDLSVERARAFLEKEEDYGIRTMLGLALLNNFAYDGLEAVRKLIIDETYEPFITDLQEDLIIACTIMEERIPEYEEWKEAVMQRRAKAEERKRSFFGKPTKSGQDEDVDHQTSGDTMQNDHKAHTIIRNAPKTGRNEPCPCGSGKKYKKCCLGKENH